MRLVIALIVAVVLGWIIGSLYPAPQAWTAGLKALMNPQPSTAAAPPPASSSAPATPSSSAPATSSPPAPSSPPPKPATRTSAHGAVDQPTLDQYRAWISQARQAHPYADSEQRMYAVMMCESRGQAALVNPAGPYSGLFQYSGGMWKGTWNTYRDQSVLDPKAQIFATALAWHNHMQGQWGCYKTAPA